MQDYLNSPGVAALVFGATMMWVVLVFSMTQWLAGRVFNWWDHRRGWRTPHEEIACWQRHQRLQRQLWDMEQQIREEQMSDEERAWHRQYRERQREIRREARRRLGLPEEGTDENGLL
jgi:hypothetical protein